MQTNPRIEEVLEYLKLLTQQILNFFELHAPIDVSQSEDGVIEIKINDSELTNFLIGYHEKTLSSLYLIILSSLNKKWPAYEPLLRISVT